MVLFAQVYQQAGWLMPTLTLLLLLAVTLTCTLMLVSCMSMLPGNAHFHRRVEYSDVTRHFLSRPFYLFSFCLYQLALLCSNIALIIQSVQVVDFLIAELLGRSCLVPQLSPALAVYSCPAAVSGGITVFGDGVWGVSIGLLLTALLVIPLSVMNLDDNIVVQKAAFALLLSICVVWAVLFVRRGLDASRVPVLGSQLGAVIGVSFANFAFLTSVPSWMNDKREDVPVASSVSLSLLLSVCMFVSMGLLCGLAFDPWTGSATLLDQVLSLATPLAKVTFYTFPVAANLSSIPVNSVFQRLNLTSQGVGVHWANFFAVVVPWLIAACLYSGNGYLDLALWSGLLVTAPVNFLIPPALYIIATRNSKQRHAHAHIQHTQNGAAEKEEEREEEEADEGEEKAQEPVDVAEQAGVERGDTACGDEEAWHVLPPRYRHLQLALGVVVLATMVSASAHSHPAPLHSRQRPWLLLSSDSALCLCPLRCQVSLCVATLVLTFVD